MKKLEVLYLHGTKVTDAGLKGLAGLKLKELYVPNSVTTDVGLEHYLAATAPATQLNLAYWKIDDASLKRLKGMKHLEQLTLQKTGVTDEGLKQLADLDNLQQSICSAPTSRTRA